MSLLLTPGQWGDALQMIEVLDRIRVPRPRGGRPRTRPDHVSGDKAYSSRQCFSPAVARVSIRRETVGSEAAGPNRAGSAGSIAMSARQSPPSATASATSRRILPGLWTDRGFR
ncbi:hypothetical protein SUDANB70_06077 (plasmid) [Streptomyces sp. enrichment culture]